MISYTEVNQFSKFNYKKKEKSHISPNAFFVQTAVLLIISVHSRFTTLNIRKSWVHHCTEQGIMFTEILCYLAHSLQ